AALAGHEEVPAIGADVHSLWTVDVAYVGVRELALLQVDDADVSQTSGAFTALIGDVQESLVGAQRQSGDAGGDGKALPDPRHDRARRDVDHVDDVQLRVRHVQPPRRRTKHHQLRLATG